MARAVTTTTEETPEYKNWIELGIGGTIVNGDNAQFEQEHRLPADTAYGGIQDLHFEGLWAKMACSRSTATRSRIPTITT